MRILMISNDRKMFETGSDVGKRIIALGAIVEHLDVIVLTCAKEGYLTRPLSRQVVLHPTNSSSKWAYADDAFKIGRGMRADVITTQDPFACGLAGRKIAKAIGAPLQVQMHTDLASPEFGTGMLNKLRRASAKRTLRQAQCIRTVSSRALRSVEPYISKAAVPPDIIPVFTDVGRYMGGERQPLTIAHPEFKQTVLMVGRLTPEKNFDLALRVFKDVIRTHPWAGLFIVGDGPERKKLERKVLFHGLKANVKFLGELANPAGMFRGADVFLHTSNYEGYGLVLLEAAAAHLPIVTTDVGLVGDILKDNESCLVCPVGDEDCLSGKLSTLLADAVYRQRLGIAAEAVAAPYADRTIANYAEEIKKSLTTCVEGTKKASG